MAGLAALLLVLVDSRATAWVALVAIGVVAAAKAFAQPAGSAALPNLVATEDLPVASVLSGASWGTMLAVGAALGGLVSGVFGPDVCFVLDALLLLSSAVLVSRTTKPFSDPAVPPRERRPVRADVAEAVTYARRDRRVLALITCKSGPAFGNGALSLFPLTARPPSGSGRSASGCSTAPAGWARCSGRCCAPARPPTRPGSTGCSPAR